MNRWFDEHWTLVTAEKKASVSLPPKFFVPPELLEPSPSPSRYIKDALKLAPIASVDPVATNKKVSGY